MSLSPAYHLRTNKAVERLLFVELLEKLDWHLPKKIKDYRYVGMGGPYLEDFALIHGTFGNRNMVSLETEANVRTRQSINNPCSRIELTSDSTEKFVERYNTSDTPLIVWFDYEGQDWQRQLSESCDLLQKLPPMSIFKITLTGKTEWLDKRGEKSVLAQSDPLLQRAQKLSSMFPNSGPFEASQLNKGTICSTLYAISRQVIAEAVPDTREKSIRTLASYEYDDGTPVLTVTMILGSLSSIEGLVRYSDLTNWPYAVMNWMEPKGIAVPYLGLRERLAVDRLLPDANARDVVKKLNLRLGKDYRESVRAMKNYLEFYQYVPQFLRISF
jgi:hypothetical protein